MRIIIIILIFLQSINSYSNSSLNYLNRILGLREKDTDKNLERLSGGVYLLKDDPANYSIYSKLEAQIREIDKRIGNNRDMISYYKYMESVLYGMNESLQKIRELLIQKDNVIFTQSDKVLIDSQIELYYEQINYDLREAEFNKVKIFNKLLNSNDFKNYFDNEKYYNLSNIDMLLDFIIRETSKTGALINRLEFQNEGDAVKNENGIAFKSGGDTDYSSEIGDLKKNSILFFANILLLLKN